MKTSKQTFVTPVGEVTYLTLTNARGSQVTLSSLGAGIIAIRVPDREGNMADVASDTPRQPTTSPTGLAPAKPLAATPTV